MKRTVGLLCLLAIPVAVHSAVTYPLMDGECSEYGEIGATTQELPHGVVLYLFQDLDYVWLCYTLPPESYGTLDLLIESPGLEAPLNLHVSAQLGEWRPDRSEEIPTVPDSELWWKIEGWYSNVVSLNGSEETEAGPRPHFLPSEARELQLAKGRFGRGEWRLRFEIRSIQVGEERVSFSYPPEEDGQARWWSLVAE